MYYIRFALVFTIFSHIVGGLPPQKGNVVIENTEDPGNEHQNTVKQKQSIPIVKLNQLDNVKYSHTVVRKTVAYDADKNISSKQEPIPISSNISSVVTNSSQIESANSKENRQEQANELEAGAVTRGALVFAGVGFLFILYAAIKTYRRKKQDKSRTLVKYGIRTTHSDLEMEPLPLSDDDDDETLFDLNASKSLSR